AVDVDALPVGEPELGEVDAVHEDHVAALLDAAVPVVEAVDRRVELVVRTQRLQDEPPRRTLEVLEFVDGDDRLADRGVEAPLVARSVRQHEAALLADVLVVALESGHDARDPFADEVVVALELGPWDLVRITEHGAREAAD